MSSGADLHVLYRIANAPIRQFPYPHIYVRDVFPSDYYWALREHIPPDSQFLTLTSLNRVAEGYPDSRQVIPFTPERLGHLPEPYRGFWNRQASWMLDGSFGQAVLPKFIQGLQQRFGDLSAYHFYDEALLVKDTSTYSLGPHTDNLKKVASFLFYLPGDDSMGHLGTTIYAPKDPEFRSIGGDHYGFEHFVPMMTLPFLPNSLFAFLKTDNSFHGVEPIADAGVRRDLLLYDIKVSNPPELARPPQDTPERKSGPTARFSF